MHFIALLLSRKAKGEQLKVLACAEAIFFIFYVAHMHENASERK